MVFHKCKYCKGTDIQFQYGETFNCTPVVWVNCKNCNNCTGRYFEKEEAFRAWNREN